MPSLSEAATLIGTRELSPLDLVEAVLDRIASEDSEFNAYVTVCEEDARREAKLREAELRRGLNRGPLHGVPIGVKDLIDTTAIRTTSGSRVRADYIPSSDAAIISRIKSAGGVIVGKTNTHEFAYGPICAPTRNARDVRRIAGGSSGGSAVAVARGMCVAAVGTDTGGSIRIPASFNGVVGLKPTYGRVPKSGITPLSWSLDHVGPITRTVGDAALLLGVIAGHDGTDPMSAKEPVDDYRGALDLDLDLGTIRLGLPRNYFREEVDPQIVAAVDQAARWFESAGASVTEVAVAEVGLAVAAEMGILLPEASAYHQGEMRRVAHLYGDDVRTLLELGELYLGTQYTNAQRARGLVKEGVRRCFETAELDALLVPTVPMRPPAIDQIVVTYAGVGERSVIGSLFRHCAPFNLTGQPVLTVPCGDDDDGLPIGLAIVGRPFAESTVLQIGNAFERGGGAGLPTANRRTDTGVS